MPPIEDLGEDARATSVLAKLDGAEGAAAAAAAADPGAGGEDPAAGAAGEQTPNESQPQGGEAAPQGDPAASGKPPAKTAEPAEPAIEPPSSWKADLKTRWKDLPRDLQQHLAQWETERTHGVNERLNEAANQRREAQDRAVALERGATEAAQLHNRYAQTLQSILQTVEGFDPVIAAYQRTDLAKLARENPAGYAELDAAYKQRVGVINAMRQEQASVQQRAMGEHFAREERALLQKVPEWSDVNVAQPALEGLRQFAVADYGFTPEEVKVIGDHRYVLMARDARDAKALRAENAQLKEEIAKRDKGAAAALAAKRVGAPASPTLRPNPAGETGDKNQSERNKAVIKQAHRTRSLAEKAELIAGIV